MKPKIDDINSMIKEILLRFAPQEGHYATPLESVAIHRRDSPTEKVNITFYRPVIVLMVQGDKHSVLGSEKCHYGKNDCLIVGVDIPSISRIVEASPEKPCLTISIEIDKYITTQLAAEISPVSKLSNASYKAMAIIPSDIELLDAFYRLAKLIDNQEQISIMAPMIIREIHYRLLTCPIGEHLKMINTLGTQSNHIAHAISWLKNNFKNTLYVDDLASQVNMATSTFHKHFKEVTTISPAQYQKRLRLHEARRLMLMENKDATTAGYEVGYESCTQFSREYKRFFGEAPIRDVNRLKESKINA